MCWRVRRSGRDGDGEGEIGKEQERWGGRGRDRKGAGEIGRERERQGGRGGIGRKQERWGGRYSLLTIKYKLCYGLD